MNVQVLIDEIMRQTTVLIAQLSTSGGLRAPLAHVADQVFLDLSQELEAQGVSRRVSADMFGMALRTYLRKIHRLRESSTERGRTLREAVYDFVRSRDVSTRSDVLRHFHRDDEGIVRGVLRDLTDSGLVFRAGTGPEALFRAASESELGKMHELKPGRLDEIVWVLIYREGPLSESSLAERLAARDDDLTDALARLEGDGHIVRRDGQGGTEWVAQRFVLPLGAEAGWEAAVLDHFQALVKTICCKLLQSVQSAASDTTGGSTYTYEVWPGHPFEEEVVGGLARFRREHGALREKVKEYNLTHALPAVRTRVIAYGGQCVVAEEISP